MGGCSSNVNCITTPGCLDAHKRDIRSRSPSQIPCPSAVNSGSGESNRIEYHPQTWDLSFPGISISAIELDKDTSASNSSCETDAAKLIELNESIQVVSEVLCNLIDTVERIEINHHVLDNNNHEEANCGRHNDYENMLCKIVPDLLPVMSPVSIARLASASRLLKGAVFTALQDVSLELPQLQFTSAMTISLHQSLDTKSTLLTLLLQKAITLDLHCITARASVLVTFLRQANSMTALRIGNCSYNGALVLCDKTMWKQPLRRLEFGKVGCHSKVLSDPIAKKFLETSCHGLTKLTLRKQNAITCLIFELISSSCPSLKTCRILSCDGVRKTSRQRLGQSYLCRMLMHLGSQLEDLDLRYSVEMSDAILQSMTSHCSPGTLKTFLSSRQDPVTTSIIISPPSRRIPMKGHFSSSSETDVDRIASKTEVATLTLTSTTWSKLVNKFDGRVDVLLYIDVLNPFNASQLVELCEDSQWLVCRGNPRKQLLQEIPVVGCRKEHTPLPPESPRSKRTVNITTMQSETSCRCWPGCSILREDEISPLSLPMLHRNTSTWIRFL